LSFDNFANSNKAEKDSFFCTFLLKILVLVIIIFASKKVYGIFKM